jgi:hypothetical protein
LKIKKRSNSITPKRSKKIKKVRYCRIKPQISEDFKKIDYEFRVLKPYLLNRKILELQMGRIAILLSENYQVLGQFSDHINQIKRDIVELRLKK